MVCSYGGPLRISETAYVCRRPLSIYVLLNLDLSFPVSSATAVAKYLDLYEQQRDMCKICKLTLSLRCDTPLLYARMFTSKKEAPGVTFCETFHPIVDGEDTTVWMLCGAKNTQPAVISHHKRRDHNTCCPVLATGRNASSKGIPIVTRANTGGKLAAISMWTTGAYFMANIHQKSFAEGLKMLDVPADIILKLRPYDLAPSFTFAGSMSFEKLEPLVSKCSAVSSTSPVYACESQASSSSDPEPESSGSDQKDDEEIWTASTSSQSDSSVIPSFMFCERYSVPVRTLIHVLITSLMAFCYENSLWTVF